MTEIFRAKVRRVGSSLGVLIPKSLALKEKIMEGEKIEVSLLKQRKLGQLLKLMGSVKGTKPFVRDRTNRLDRY